MKVHVLNAADIQSCLGLSCIQSVYRWIKGVNIPSVDHLYALGCLRGTMSLKCDPCLAFDFVDDPECIQGIPEVFVICRTLPD